MFFSDLDHDVLAIITGHLHRRALCVLGCTSRWARSAILPALLHSVTLAQSQTQIRKFCDFILSDTQRYSPLLCQLTIDSLAFSHYESDDGTSAGLRLDPSIIFAASLADTLHCAVNLRYLAIDLLEDLLELEPRIGLAIANCKHLYNIRFDWVGRRVMSTLARLQGLRVARIHVMERLNLGELLDPLQPSLEELTIDHGFAGRRDFGAHRQWPRLCTLHAPAIIFADCAALTRAFPNLQNLSVTNNPSVEHTDLEPRLCWNRLNSATGWLTGLHYLGLSCPVKNLRIQGDKLDKVKLADLLRATEPMALSFQLDQSLLAARVLLEVSPKLANLRCLTLELHLWMPNAPRDFVASIPNLPLYLAGLPIEYLCLELFGWKFEVEPAFWIDNFDSNLLLPIAQALPHLQWVTRFALEERMCWRIERNGDAPRAHPILKGGYKTHKEYMKRCF